MSVVALSEMLGAAVRDESGSVRGRVRDIAITPQEHGTRVAFLVVRTSDGDRVLPAESVRAYGAIIRTGDASTTWGPFAISDGVLLLKRDLLDQQIIDVHGRKVVRVNDVELYLNPTDSRTVLDVLSVDISARGAVRRLAKGIVPSFTLRSLLEKIPPRVIPWRYVDLIETDPARRVKLKIAYEGLSKMHPADIADIVEDLPPAEQKAVFETLDRRSRCRSPRGNGPEVQVSIVESLDKNRAADIVGDGPRRGRRPAWRPHRSAVRRDPARDGAGGARGSHATARVWRTYRRRTHDRGVHRRAGRQDGCRCRGSTASV
ncbi:MAG: hypothetical protein U0Q11_24835 [Vicinamibacterales bacterium]